MSDLRAAAQAALEALENLDGIDTETECVTIDCAHEIGLLREALAAPVLTLTDELMNCVDRLGSEADSVDPRVWPHLQAYTPAAAPLTREQVAALAAQAMGNPLLAEDLLGGFNVHTEMDDWQKFAALARGADAAAVQPAEPADDLKQLMRFYGASGVEEVARTQARQIERLQERLTRLEPPSPFAHRPARA